jgi:hypothetical protein
MVMEHIANIEREATSISVKRLIEQLPNMEGVNEVVVLRKNGDILFYHSQRPLLKNSVPFIVNKSKQAGAIFGFAGFRYAAMQRGKGKKMIVIATNNLMVGLEADARCLQKVLLEKLQPLLALADEGE